MNNISSQIINGIKWNTIGQYSRQLLYFIISIILARLLEPSEFGLIAMLSIFIGISEAFIHSGLGAGLVHRNDMSRIDYSTVFVFNLLTAIFFFFCINLTAPLIANYFKEPELKNIINYLSFSFIINAIGMVPNYILVKSLNFKALNIISFYCVLISAPIAIFLAYYGFGAYSLVIQTLIYVTVNCILSYYYTKWIPSFQFSFASFKKLFKFGFNILMSIILEKVLKNIDTLLIGRTFSKNTLGFYTRAKTTRDLAIDNSSSIVTNIIFPIFSKIENEIDRNKMHLKMISFIAHVNFPLMVILIILAKPIIIILFSEKWIFSIEYFQLLCISGLFIPIILIISQTILSKGLSGYVLFIDIINKGCFIIAIIIGTFWDMTFMLYFIIISSVISFLLTLLIAKKILIITLKDYFIALKPSIILSILIFIPLLFLSKIPINNIYLYFIFLSVCGMSLYFLTSIILKNYEFYYLRNMIINKAIPRIKNLFKK